MSFWQGLSLMSRARVARKTREERRESPFCSVLVPKHDQLQQSPGYGWSFDECGQTSFLDCLEPATNIYGQSDDTSRHMSLTTVSLMRLVSEDNAADGHTSPPRALAAARTECRVLPVNNHTSSCSLTAISSPCQFCFTISMVNALLTNYILHFDGHVIPHLFNWEHTLSHEPSITETQGSADTLIASTSLLDLYLLQSSSCINAGINTTLPSSTVMDGQSPSKGARRLSGSTTLSTLEGLVEAYAASERSEVSPAFIHAGDLDRQSYVDARREVAAGPPSLPAPGPAPSLLLPPPPVYRPAPYRGEDESDEAVPTPPTRILDRAPPPSVSRFLSGLGSGVFHAEESDHDSVSAMGQQEEETSVLGEVKASQPYETSFGRYNLFPDVELAPRISRPDSTIPQISSNIHPRPSTLSLASTIPFDISGYNDDQDLVLQRQDKPTPRLIENARTHSLINDTMWLRRDKEGRRRSWALFVICAIFPFILFLFAFGVFDKIMVQLAGTHARPTLRQKSLAKYLCVVEIVAWPSLVA